MITRLFVWFIAFIVPCCILFGGLGGLWTSGGYLMDAYSSGSWPQATGKVIRSQLGSESDFKQSDDRTRYWPEVEFEYEVDGTKYVSNNITLDGLRYGPRVGTGKNESEEVLARYPIDASVEVYYKPDDPERAVLETGVSANNFFVPIFSVVLILIGGVWLGAMLFSTKSAGDNETWGDRERVCPKCQTAFTSVQDKGACPKCRHVFLASEVMNI